MLVEIPSGSPYIEYVYYACIVYTDGGVNGYNDFINSDSGGWYRCSKNYPYNGQPDYWWLRSPTVHNGIGACYVNLDGSLTNATYTDWDSGGKLSRHR